MSILNTRRIAAISFAVTSLLTLSLAHADSDQRGSGEAHVSSHESQRSEAAPNTWMQTKYFWLQHTTNCEAASSTVTDPVQRAASVSTWKAAKYPALQAPCVLLSNKSSGATSRVVRPSARAKRHMAAISSRLRAKP